LIELLSVLRYEQNLKITAQTDESGVYWYALWQANYKRRLDEASKNAEKLRQSVSLAERLRKREEELRINEIAKTTEIVKKLKEEIEALKVPYTCAPCSFATYHQLSILCILCILVCEEHCVCR